MMEVNVDWVRKIYADGRAWHVGNMVKWKGVYYICFVDGTGHGSEDSQIRVCASTDLENWTSQIVIGRKTIDPNLLPVGDKLLLYGVKESKSKGDSDLGFPSQQVVTSTEDGTNWTEPKRCFLMNHDFWHPTEFNGRYYVACDTVGHAPLGIHNSVDLLTSDDGERWQWVAEIVHGSDEPEYYDTTGIQFGTPAPSETALCFFDDGRLLAVTRARGHCALLSTSKPPYDKWERYLSRESRCYGSAIARVGEHILVTGRSFENEGIRSTENKFNDKFSEHDGTQLRTGLFLYENSDLQLRGVLPSGGDTGYAGILPVSDNKALVAYYSTYESAPGPNQGSSVYLAAVSIQS
jgi:hypothetical protein